MKVTNRRDFFKIASAAAATTAFPAVAAHHEPSISVEAEIMVHAEEILRLLKKSAPDDAYLKGFQFTCMDGEINPDSVWSTVQLTNHNLAHMRPAVRPGWREQTIRIVGNTSATSIVEAV